MEEAQHQKDDVQHHVEDREAVGPSRGVVEEAEEEGRVAEGRRQREHDVAKGALVAQSRPCRKERNIFCKTTIHIHSFTPSSDTGYYV